MLIIIIKVATLMSEETRKHTRRTF